MISNLIIPVLIILIVLYGIIKKVNIYDSFVEGAKESFKMIKDMFPFLLGMMLAINIFLNSNILNLFSKAINFLIPLPFEVIPLALMRPISGSSSLSILNNIFNKFGPDSYIGTLASVIQGSTDTTLYIITLYFGAIGIKKTRYALAVGLIADLIGITASIFIVNIFF
ncbi:MAG: spore maturation protein [Bacilli bacterium]